jgi:hypothetical protein
MTDLLTIDTAGPVARLTLTRPEKRNALSPELLEALIDAARALDAQPEVTVAILSGAGRSFCAGFDLNSFAAQEGEGRTRETADLGRRMAEAVTTMRAVTIAQVHGHCVGGGLVLAAACDLRVAAEDTMFSIPEVELGIPLAWGGIPRLVREIGPAMTKELVNATSGGVLADESPNTCVVLAPEQLELDVNYARTRLLRDAEAAGCTVSDGETMLLNQGAAAFTLWTGQPAPLDVMGEALANARAHGLRSAEGESAGTEGAASTEAAAG